MGFWKSLFYCRVGIIGLFAIAALPLATFGPTAAVFIGLFDIDGASPVLGVGLVTLTALMVTFACLAVINLVLDHGPERFDCADLPEHYDPPRWLFCLSLLPATWLIWRICQLSLGLSAGEKFWGVLGGAVFAILGWLFAQTVQFALARQDAARRPQYLIYPLNRVPVIGHIVDWAYHQTPCFNDQALWLHGALRDRIFRHFGPGFVYLDPGSKENTIYSGHLFALALSVISLLLWWAIGYAKQPFLGDQRTTAVIPSLAFVLVAWLALVWLFSALAFLLDYIRFPLAAGLAAIILTFGGFLHFGDHYFRVPRDTNPRPIGPKPSEVLGAHARNGVPILVATAGGGIQAAFWTAKTIEQFDTLPALNRRKGYFRSQLTAISSVSGGSVGSMFVGSALFDHARSKVKSLDEASNVAAQSSLDEAAWGWMYADLRRALLPMFASKFMDRGWALEIAWANRISAGDVPEPYLDDWADYGSKHLDTFPAFLFNASNVEAGAPLVLANGNFPSAGNLVAQRRGLKGFETMFNDRLARIRLVTAVRLSASFPFVSPAARAEIDPGFHFVDGGYYDNFGLLSLLDWLSQALEQEKLRHAAEAPKKLAIVVLRPFPSPVDPASEQVGWSYQLYAPLVGAVNILQKEQWKEDQAKFEIFRRTLLPDIDIQLFEIPFPRDVCQGGAELPTSWRLTKAQKECTNEAWKRILDSPAAGTDSEMVAKTIQELAKFIDATSDTRNVKPAKPVKAPGDKRP